MIKTFELYSFDVFDTLITRRVGVPRGIFALMQEKIKDKISLPKDFYTIRCESERFAREIADCREITFDDIYRKMQVDYNLSDETIKYLKDLELKTELENLVGIDENILKVKELLKKEERVVLISDMYHSSNTIRMFLSHISPIFEKIKIYVSSEYKTSKYEGKLFRIVQQQENIKPQKWVHTGDNKNSDIKKAKNLKIKTEYFEFPKLMKYEEELLELYPDNVDYQKLVGASLITRLNKSKNKEKYDFGASFTAPIVYNYVNWILEESLKKGFKTLHFIARDGYIPKIVADMIIEKRGLDIKTKYIYGSRLAWRVPCEENYNEFIEMMLNDCCDRLSLKFLTYRLHVDVSSFNKYINEKDINKIFNNEERFELKNKLLKNHNIKKFILSANNERKKLLLEYIKQEIDLSDSEVAFVDINGSGKTQDILSFYINKIDSKRVHCFYLTTNLRDNNTEKSIKYTFCIEPKSCYHYLELIFKSLDGQTICYSKENNKIVPMLETLTDNILIAWGFIEYVNGIKAWVNCIYDNHNFNFDPKICYVYHDYITVKCSSETAQLLGELPFATIGPESNLTSIIPHSSFSMLSSFLANGCKINKLTDFSYLTKNGTSNILMRILFKMSDFHFSSRYLTEFKLYLTLRNLKQQTIMFWGASLWLEDFIKKYKIKNENILGIIDKNPNRQGCYIGSYQIFSPDNLNIYSPDFILMTIKNRNRSIYYDVDNFISKNYPNIKLLPNIFENDFLFSFKKKEKEIFQTQKLSQQIFNMENNINRLIQNNISTAFLHQKTFTQFKGCHQGQEIVILATGPSAEKYQPIKNAIHIGVNRAFQLNKVNLDYIFLQDYSGKTIEYIDELDNYNKDKCIKFYGLTCEWLKNPNRVIPESHAIKANALRYRTDWADIENFKPQFAYDISTQPLGCFGTVVFPALQFALWTYPKRIYLVGCDCSLNGYAYNSAETNILNPNKLITAYNEFKVFANTYYPDIEIISINPIGLKGLFKDIY